MRTVITFLTVIATLNATARVGSAYWNHYQLQDTVEGIITFGGATPPETLQQQVIEKAERLDVSLDYDMVTVTREGATTTVDASYTKDIEVFPRFSHEFQFRVHASTVFTGTAPLGQR